MKSRTKLILLGISVFVISLIMLMPASFALQMAGTGNSGVRLINASGTIWNGKADSVVAMQQEFNKIEWQIHPLSLLVGNLNVDIRSLDDDYPLQGNISVDLDGNVEAEDINGILPASIIRQFKGAALVGLEGKMSIKLKNIAIDNQIISSVNGEIFLSQGQLVSPVNATLGDIKFVLSDQKGNVHIAIKDQGAPIGIEGTLVLKPGNKMSFNAYLSPGANADQFLMTMIKNVATPQSDGRLKLQYDGAY